MVNSAFSPNLHLLVLELFFLVVASGEIRTDKVMEKSQEKAYQEKDIVLLYELVRRTRLKTEKKASSTSFF